MPGYNIYTAIRGHGLAKAYRGQDAARDLNG